MATRRFRGTTIIGVAVVAGVLSAAGCGSGSDDASPSASSPRPSQSVSAEISGGDGSAKTGTNLELPDSWPQQLPLPDGVAVNNVVEGSAGTVVSAATPYTSVQDTVAAFQEAWGSDEVTITEVVSTSVAGGLKVDLGDGQTAALAVSMTGDTATVVMTLS